MQTNVADLDIPVVATSDESRPYIHEATRLNMLNEDK